MTDLVVLLRVGPEFLLLVPAVLVSEPPAVQGHGEDPHHQDGPGDEYDEAHQESCVFCETKHN